MSNPGSRTGSTSRLQPPKGTASQQTVCGRTTCSGSRIARSQVPGTSKSNLPGTQSQRPSVPGSQTPCVSQRTSLTGVPKQPSTTSVQKQIGPKTCQGRNIPCGQRQSRAIDPVKPSNVTIVGRGEAAKVKLETSASKRKPSVHHTRMIVKVSKLKSTDKTGKCTGPCSALPSIPPFTEEIERGRPVPPGRYYIPVVGQADANLPEAEKKLRQKLQKYQPTTLSHWKVEHFDPFAKPVAPLKKLHPDVVSGMFTSARGEYQPENADPFLEQRLDPSIPDDMWSASLREAMSHENNVMDFDDEDAELLNNSPGTSPGAQSSPRAPSPRVCPGARSPLPSSPTPSTSTVRSQDPRHALYSGISPGALALPSFAPYRDAQPVRTPPCAPCPGATLVRSSTLASQAPSSRASPARIPQNLPYKSRQPQSPASRAPPNYPPYTPSLIREPQSPCYTPSMVRPHTPPPRPPPKYDPYTPSLMREPQSPCYTPSIVRPHTPPPRAPPEYPPYTPSLVREPVSPCYTQSIVRPHTPPSRAPPEYPPYMLSLVREPQLPCYTPSRVQPRTPPPPRTPSEYPHTPSIMREPKSPCSTPSMIRPLLRAPPEYPPYIPSSVREPQSPCYTPNTVRPGTPSSRVHPEYTRYTSSLRGEPQSPCFTPSMVRSRTPPPMTPLESYTPSLMREPQPTSYTQSMVQSRTPPPRALPEYPRHTPNLKREAQSPCYTPSVVQTRTPSPRTSPEYPSYTPNFTREPQSPYYSPSMLESRTSPARVSPEYPPRTSSLPENLIQQATRTPPRLQQDRGPSPCPGAGAIPCPKSILQIPFSPIEHERQEGEFSAPGRFEFATDPPQNAVITYTKKDESASIHPSSLPPLLVPPCIGSEVTCSSKPLSPRLPFSPTQVPLPVSPISLEPITIVPNYPKAATLDTVRRLVAEERQDVTASSELPPTLIRKINKMRMKPQSIRALEEALNESIPMEDENDLVKSDHIASLLHSQEAGVIDPSSSPHKTFEHLFPPLADETPITVSAAAPALLADIVVPISEATIVETAVVNKEIAQVSADANSTLDGIPDANVFAEAIKNENILQNPLPRQTTTESPKIESGEYAPHMNLDEEKPPWTIDLSSLENLVGGKLSGADTGNNMPSDESLRARAGRIEYLLDVQKPLYYSCVQLRGSQMPAWFPGYYSVMPHVEGHIRLERSPSRAFAAAWNVLGPCQQTEQSEVLVL